MVGRERERRLLADAWERVVSERSCHLFTVLGPAGQIVRGRCLSYGEGVTYWPVVEVDKQLLQLELDELAGAGIASDH